MVFSQKIRHSVSKETLISIYYAIFRSHLTYAFIVRGQNPTGLRSKLGILQNKALRIINFKERREHADPLYNVCEIPKLEDHIKIQIWL